MRRRFLLWVARKALTTLREHSLDEAYEVVYGAGYFKDYVAREVRQLQEQLQSALADKSLAEHKQENPCPDDQHQMILLEQTPTYRKFRCGACLWTVRRPYRGAPTPRQPARAEWDPARPLSASIDAVGPIEAPPEAVKSNAAVERARSLAENIRKPANACPACWERGHWYPLSTVHGLCNRCGAGEIKARTGGEGSAMP